MQSPPCSSGVAISALMVDSTMEILIQIPDIILYRFNALHMHENKLTMCQEKALVLVVAFSVIVKHQYYIRLSVQESQFHVCLLPRLDACLVLSISSILILNVKALITRIRP